MPIPAWLYGAGLGVDILGRGLSGGQQASMDKYRADIEKMIAEKQLGLQEKLGERELTIAETKDANELRRQLETTPLRDILLYRLGYQGQQAPQEFKPYDMFTPGTAKPGEQQMGGYDKEALAQHMTGYTPGAGGTRPDMIADMLAKLGYQQGAQPTPEQPLGFAGGLSKAISDSTSRGGLSNTEYAEWQRIKEQISALESGRTTMPQYMINKFLPKMRDRYEELEQIRIGGGF